MKLHALLGMALLWAGAVAAATFECEQLGIAGGKVQQNKLASGGAEVRFALEQLHGAAATVPLPAELKAGKYELLLRLRFEPADAYSDSFTLQAGMASQTFMPTDFSDAKSPEFRLWRMTFTVDDKAPPLTLTVNRNQYYTEPKTAAVLLDALTIQERSRDISITGVRPNKVLYMPDEEAVCQVKLRNVSAAAAQRQLRLVEVLDVGTTREIGKQAVKLEAKGEQAVAFKWKVGKEQYGREVRAEVLDQQGKAADWASEYFNVADNVWKVAMRAPGGPHMTHPDSKWCDIRTPEAWDKYLVNYADRLHGEYGNFMEWFAWAPDDAFFMTPTAPMWISGQGAYAHLRTRVLDLNRVMNENGVWPITYAKSAASGPPCFEFMRKHPEYGQGRYQVQFDQQFVRDWDKQIPAKDNTIYYTWLSLVLDITKPGIVDYAINEILNSGEMFGFRGARYDDHYTFWGQPYHELSTKNMQRIFDIGKKRNPNFVWGFNYIVQATQCVWPGQPLADTPWKQKLQDAALPPDPRAPAWAKMPEPYPELKIACENGGYIMNEEAREARTGTYGNYAKLLVHETSYVRQLGGHYGPIPFDNQGASAFDRIYPDILRAAARAHTYGDIRADSRFKQFLTRYSSYIYGTALEPIPDPEPVLTVNATPGAWWHMFAYNWKDAGKRRVLVHLVSAPKSDKINSNKTGTVEMVTNAAVTYAGPEEVERAWELSPFIDGFIQPLVCENKTVKPAPFHLWKMVLFELKGGAQ